jgi:hypothetical protein
LGIDVITPEITVNLSTDMDRKSSILSSTSWKLSGNSNLLKDSNFLKTFDIRLEGNISSINAPKNTVVGTVGYHVQGKSPLIFRFTPAIIETTISQFKKPA